MKLKYDYVPNILIGETWIDNSFCFIYRNNDNRYYTVIQKMLYLSFEDIINDKKAVLYYDMLTQEERDACVIEEE